MSDLSAALIWKYGDVASTAGDEIVGWSHASAPQPDAGAIAALFIEYDAHMVAVAYKTERQGAMADTKYGTVSEQLELLGEQGIVKYQEHIAAVKAANPKPT
jgi:hypothetical protein